MISNETRPPEQSPEFADTNITPVQEDNLMLEQMPDESVVASTDESGNAETQTKVLQDTTEQIPPSNETITITPTAPAQADTPPTPASPPTSVAQGSSSLKDIRLGTHPEYTRIVLDLTNKDRFETKLDNENHTLTVSLSGTSYNSIQNKTLSGFDLLEGYTVQPTDDNAGTLVIFSLYDDIKIIKTSSFGGNNNDVFKIIIDINEQE